MRSSVEDFAERVGGSIMGTFEVAGIYLGDKLGLYQALGEAPATSTELAERAGIHERYAREWLEQQAATGAKRRHQVGHGAQACDQCARGPGAVGRRVLVQHDGGV